ncbi:hypothetical protein TEA_021471 [Camellia sinensis var. sinensis]|uniref:Carboxypeptidase n=1 Tax=Camellia sinensis var. sinensis TaxID=542762 RepID=A0A4S4D1D7_CAMSN|nr:hypothetical protein TEA_021471 [Camellia sinensis var. sinensis]
MGAMTEIGPFGVNPDGKMLYTRTHAWNKVANILFVESPAGVGFSYSNTTSDYKVTADKRTGFYIPELADTIIKRNKEADPILMIQLKGIMPKCPGDYDPCESDYVNAYLNLPQVQEALHANRTKLPYTWQLCSSDVDAVVPVTSTRYSIDALKLKVIKPWHPWTDDGEQEVNYVTESTATEYSPVYVGPQDGLKAADKILSLPGQPNGINFDQYSGYVRVDPNAGRALFYYFAESQNSSSKPLVLWLNGGPGCSSFGNGAMMELGPFRVNSDGLTLSENKYAWNNAANILFLESPAGVGFSYSNTTSDYDKSGDARTAADSYTFLVNWLERFPEYKTRDFFITGESYAGHYVPQLAQLILQNNKVTNQTVINLQGIAIGNAYVDYETEYTGVSDFFWTHALISDEIYEGIVANCNFSSDANISLTCQDYLAQAGAAGGNIYPYNIYAPLCLPSSSNAPPVSIFDPCTENYIAVYLNIPQVQKSLHANVTGLLPGPWQSCNDYIGSVWNDQPLTVLPIIQELMASGISVWIYSGDTDSVVPVTTTKYGIDKLQTSVKTKWYPWYLQGEVGGYVVGYENLTFVTIRGAGHFVPSYQPARALAFFSSFLDGILPPTN